MGRIRIYCGDGKGKTAAVIGQGLQYADQGKIVFMIQFLKGKSETKLLNRLEPEMKCFCFEKAEVPYDELNEAERKEENMNVINALNFARKVLSTGECDVLILDELLGVLDNQIITLEQVKELLECKQESQEILLTGNSIKDTLVSLADEVYEIQCMK